MKFITLNDLGGNLVIVPLQHVKYIDKSVSEGSTIRFIDGTFLAVSLSVLQIQKLIERETYYHDHQKS